MIRRRGGESHFPRLFCLFQDVFIKFFYQVFYQEFNFRYKDIMERLPRIMAHNFDVIDNLNDTVTYEYVKNTLILKTIGIKAIPTEARRLPKECYNKTYGTWNPDIYNDVCEVYNSVGTLDKKLSYMSLDKRVPLPHLNEVNGTIRFTIVYTMDKIARINKIDVVPSQ